MKSRINSRTIGWLLAAGFAFGTAAAQAASGITISAGQETRVAVGMTTAEVQQNLGRPADIVKYHNEAGPTWSYEVSGAPFGQTVFYVDFGADGKVTSATEYVLGDS